MSKNGDNNRIFLSTYLLHKDNRIRLPKAIENNLSALPGETYFDIYFDAMNREVVLRVSEKTTAVDVAR